VIAALAFGGVVGKAGVLDRLITPIINAAKSVGALIISVVFAVLATNIVTADQYMAVVLPARMFKKAIAERGLAPVVLSRAVGASGMPTSALIRSCSTGAYMAATLDVATLSYLPYGVFNLAVRGLAIALAYAEVRMLRGEAPQERARRG